MPGTEVFVIKQSNLNFRRIRVKVFLVALLIWQTPSLLQLDVLAMKFLRSDFHVWIPNGGRFYDSIPGAVVFAAMMMSAVAAVVLVMITASVGIVGKGTLGKSLCSRVRRTADAAV